MTVACDWDGVLADPQTQEWLPGAQQALRRILSAGHRVIVHTCRANWPEGLAAVRQKLAAAGLPVDVWADQGKPHADLYIDDRAVHFGGDWSEIVQQLERRKTAPSISRRPKPPKRRQVWH
jgi:hypothetical protein